MALFCFVVTGNSLPGFSKISPLPLPSKLHSVNEISDIFSNKSGPPHLLCELRRYFCVSNRMAHSLKRPRKQFLAVNLALSWSCEQIVSTLHEAHNCTDVRMQKTVTHLYAFCAISETAVIHEDFPIAVNN